MKTRSQHSGTGVPPVSSISRRRDARATKLPGVRPSPGAAMPKFPGSSSFSNVAPNFEAAAPGDGRTPIQGRKNGAKTGSATLVVLVLLGLMSMLMVTNSRALSHLKRQLDSVEQRQLQKFKPPVAERPEVEQNSAAP